jgi:hypothetical protein
MEQILWGIAIPITLIYVAQAIVTFIGLGRFIKTTTLTEIRETIKNHI